MKVDRFVGQVTPLMSVFDVRGLKNVVEQFNDILHWIKE